MFNAPFIVCSGLDGCGKSTQISALMQHYKRSGHRVIWRWSRGGYTPLFLSLKAFVRRCMGRSLPSSGRSNQREAMLKKKGVSTVWLQLSIWDLILYYGVYFRLLGVLGYTLIGDRYIDDTYIDFKLNFPSVAFETWWSWRCLQWIARRPQYRVYLDIPLDVSLDRLSRKDEPFPDSPEVLAKRLELYQSRVDSSGYTTIDANQSQEAVTQDILSVIT